MFIQVCLETKVWIGGYRGRIDRVFREEGFYRKVCRGCLVRGWRGMFRAKRLYSGFGEDICRGMCREKGLERGQRGRLGVGVWIRRFGKGLQRTVSRAGLENGLQRYVQVERFGEGFRENSLEGKVCGGRFRERGLNRKVSRRRFEEGVGVNRKFQRGRFEEKRLERMVWRERFEKECFQKKV